MWSLYWPTLLVVILFTLFERRFPLEADQPWRPWLFYIVWHTQLLAISVVLSWTVWGQFVTWLGASGQLSLLRMAAPQGLAGEVARVALALLAHDFLMYWAHRLQHGVPVLWVLHQFHHDERHVNASTSLRTHWLSLMLTQLMVMVPMMWLLGFEAMPPAAYVMLTTFVAISHLNAKVGFGRFAALIVGPQYHRVHHSPERRLHDRNFATVLPLWDIAFGTWAAPTGNRDRPLGLSYAVPSNSHRRVLVQPFVDWWRMARRAAVRI